uniref:Oxidative damage protection protein n=1 Tax=Thermus islandicus TaxID=540988 RepID=A0A7C2FTL4_9DEIN
MSASTVLCQRCGQEGPALPFPPLPNAFGERVHRTICEPCWQEWLRFQTMLINHYGLNLRDPEARRFLLEQGERFLFRSGETEAIDTSQQGTIAW